MRVLFIDDDGMSVIAPYVKALGHQPVVLRTGVYDSWHANECDAEGLEVHHAVPQTEPLDLLRQARALQPDAVVSLALLDPFCWRDAVLADYFRSARQLPVVANSAATVMLAGDKLHAKLLLKEHGIRVTEAVPINTLDEALAAARVLGYPLVLKRNDGYSGQGMRLVHEEAGLRRFFQRGPADMLAEHFTQGIELSVDVLRWNGQTRALAVVHKGATDQDLRRHPIYRLRVAPAPFDADLSAHIKRVAEQAMDVLGIVGLAECEMILHPQHGVMVLEVNPRIAGTARLSAAATGIDIHRCLVDMATGRFDAELLPIQPELAVQIPASGELSDEVIERLRSMREVRFIKPINWMPDLAISASLTVAAADLTALLSVLQQIDGFLSLQPALHTMVELYKEQSNFLE